MLDKIWSMYSPRLPYVIVYMMQQVEYDPVKFGLWVGRFPNYNRVIYRQQLDTTKKARMLLLVSYISWLVYVNVVAGLLIIGNLTAAVVFIVFLPLVTMSSVIVAVLAGKVISYRSNKRLLTESKVIFEKTKAIKIAVVGSYGKTTMKELLRVVLAEGMSVAATPGNMNVSVSHAKFAKSFTGSEKAIIIEFGEGSPGDVMSMSEKIRPDYAVITGLAPNHLDHYPSLKALAGDLLTVRGIVKKGNTYISTESEMLKPHAKKFDKQFNSKGVDGWKVTNAVSTIDGVTFSMSKGDNKLNLQSGLLGRHQIAPLACVVSVAHELGLSTAEIQSGISKTVPFEHRMQPRSIHGAWIIDDTYNGNLEGLKAGLKLLQELKFKRKWYVTPGLVDQGDETLRVHRELGEVIAKAQPDKVVLMENSMRPIIEQSMQDNGFQGELNIEPDPLAFYTNIEHIIAAGDLVLMQNDWTDNYN